AALTTRLPSLTFAAHWTALVASVTCIMPIAGCRPMHPRTPPGTDEQGTIMRVSVPPLHVSRARPRIPFRWRAVGSSVEEYCGSAAECEAALPLSAVRVVPPPGYFLA